MRLLLLGGTSFVGRAIVEEALRRDHDITLFSRGKTGTDLFPTVERRTGDRDLGDYTALSGGTWDAVVDVSGYVPRHVREAVAAVDGRAARYLFISTGSVYDPAGAVDGMAEDAPRLPPEHSTEEVTGETYGPLKVACEDELLDRLGDRATIVRPGIVAGPYDPTDRFTYWVRRAARGGTVALPGRPEQPVQVVDSRDLARLVVALVEDDRAGTYNAVGPADATTMAELVHSCAQAAGASVEIVPVAAERAPLVVEDARGEALFQRSADRARQVGLTATPLLQTATDVLAWDRERGAPPLAVGLSEEREAELLAGVSGG